MGTTPLLICEWEVIRRTQRAKPPRVDNTRTFSPSEREKLARVNGPMTEAMRILVEVGGERGVEAAELMLVRLEEPR